MSTLKVNKLRDTAGSADAITLDPNGGAVLAGVTTISTARITTGITTSIQVGGGVTISESGIEASGIGITCANINGTQIGGRRNLIINGAMNVAQRGTSSTSVGYVTLDRFNTDYGGENEAMTYTQADVSSGTSPYTEGFRKTFKVQNGDQTGGAGTGDYVFIRTKLEAQDLANSGWNYTSSSSFITMSFWVKSSVAQTFYGRLESVDGTAYNYPYSYSVSADTWTKVVKTIPGNSNLQIDNNNGSGMEFHWDMFRGTGFSDSGVSLNTWATYASGTRTPDQTNTWWETNDATWEITGIQVEVGSQATAFEHRSFGDELALCQRYYELIAERDEGSNSKENPIGLFWGDGSNFFTMVPFKVKKRSQPTLDISNYTNAFRAYGTSGGVNVSTMSANALHRDGMLLEKAGNPGSSGHTRLYDASGGLKALVAASSEL